MKRPPIDEVRAAVIAKRISGDANFDESAYWCETCEELWFDHYDSQEYATWLCKFHWEKRREEFRNCPDTLDPKISTLPLWRKS